MDSWYHKRFIGWLLIPLTVIYRLVIALRRFLYHCGAKKVTKFAVPVIVVGNITVGGTGKTPLVIALASLLKEYGYRPGIVSRGYGGKALSYPQRVTAKSDPVVVGDEALLLARRTACPVVIAPDRVAAVQRLLADEFCNIVISDDGLQHYALARDIEIVTLDGERGVGNGFCLPAGPLREPVKRLATVDFVVITKNYAASSAKDYLIVPNAYSLFLKPTALHSVRDPTISCPIATFNGKTVHAIAGIGNPSRFFKLLKQQELQVIEHAFPDHYLFKPQDIDCGQGAIVIMTEKDAVKCQRFADDRHWYLPVDAELDEVFKTALHNYLMRL